MRGTRVPTEFCSYLHTTPYHTTTFAVSDMSHASLFHLFPFHRLPRSLRSFTDIGGGGKRKPPPMHRMRRLREPRKIHRRRRNCSMRAVTLLCVFQVKFLRLPSDASHVRRVAAALGTPPYHRSRGTRDPTAREIYRSECLRRRDVAATQAERDELYQNRRAGINRCFARVNAILDFV